MRFMNRVAVIASVAMFSFLSFAWSQDEQAPMSFEDVTRENTVDAYMTFIEANPTEKDAGEAYRLMKDVLPGEIKITNKLAPAGSKKFHVTWMMEESAKALQICGSGVPPTFYTAFKHTQTIINTTKYPLAFLEHKMPKGKTTTIYEVTFIQPGKKFVKAINVKGTGCSQKPKYSGRGKQCKRSFACPKKPEIDTKKTLVDLFVVPADLAKAYADVVKSRDPKAAAELMKSHPHSPINKSLNAYLKPWMEEVDARLKKSVPLKVSYTKKFSPAFSNPYDLIIKNNGKVAVQMLLQIEVWQTYFLTLLPGEEKKVSGETEKGKEARYSLLSLSPEILQIPSLMLVEKNSSSTDKKSIRLLLEFSSTDLGNVRPNEISGTYYYLDNEYNNRYNSIGTFSVSGFGAETKPEGTTYRIPINFKVQKGEKRDGVDCYWKSGAWSVYRYDEVTYPDQQTVEEVKTQAEPKQKEKGKGRRR